MSVFEIIMLICFGFAWPISIYKSWISKSTGGKSPLFSIVVIIGYISGMIHKWMFSRDIVMFLYLLNMVMVSIDLYIYFRNKRFEKVKNEATNTADKKLQQRKYA